MYRGMMIVVLLCCSLGHALAAERVPSSVDGRVFLDHLGRAIDDPVFVAAVSDPIFGFGVDQDPGWQHFRRVFSLETGLELRFQNGVVASLIYHIHPRDERMRAYGGPLPYAVNIDDPTATPGLEIKRGVLVSTATINEYISLLVHGRRTVTAVEFAVTGPRPATVDAPASSVVEAPPAPPAAPAEPAVAGGPPSDRELLTMAAACVDLLTAMLADEEQGLTAFQGAVIDESMVVSRYRFQQSVVPAFYQEADFTIAPNPQQLTQLVHTVRLVISLPGDLGTAQRASTAIIGVLVQRFHLGEHRAHCSSPEDGYSRHDLRFVRPDGTCNVIGRLTLEQTAGGDHQLTLTVAYLTPPPVVPDQYGSWQDIQVLRAFTHERNDAYFRDLLADEARGFEAVGDELRSQELGITYLFSSGGSLLSVVLRPTWPGDLPGGIAFDAARSYEGYSLETGGAGLVGQYDRFPVGIHLTAKDTVFSVSFSHPDIKAYREQQWQRIRQREEAREALLDTARIATNKRFGFTNLQRNEVVTVPAGGSVSGTVRIVANRRHLLRLAATTTAIGSISMTVRGDDGAQLTRSGVRDRVDIDENLAGLEPVDLFNDRAATATYTISNRSGRSIPVLVIVTGDGPGVRR